MHKKYAAKISIFLISILSCLFLFSCADPNNGSTKEESEESKFINTYLIGSFKNSEDSSFFIQFTKDNIIINPNAETHISAMDKTQTKEMLFSTEYLTQHELDMTDWQLSDHSTNRIELDDNRKPLITPYYDENNKLHESEKLDYIKIDVENGKTLNDYAKITNGPFHAVIKKSRSLLPKYKAESLISLKNLAKTGDTYSGSITVPYYSFSESQAFSTVDKRAEFRIVSGTHKTGTWKGIDRTFTEDISSETPVSNEKFQKNICYNCYNSDYLLRYESDTIDFTFNIFTGELIFSSVYCWDDFSECNKVFKKLNYIPPENEDDNPSDDDNSNSLTDSDLIGTYTISEANGSAFTFAQDGTWTYRYNSSTTEGTWSVSDGKLTITYTLGSISSTAVFTVSVSGDTYTLTGNSGDYITIITSAFKITNLTAVQDGVVTLVKQ